jgi:hypothetical protein
MNLIYDEICRRFPEVRSMALDDNANEPYTLVTMLAKWLGRVSAETITNELVKRVQAFTRWCEDQPRGETAADDILTILVLGFYEQLFATEHTRALLPRIVSKEEFEQNAEYLKDRVGAENYEKAAKFFKAG